MGLVANTSFSIFKKNQSSPISIEVRDPATNALIDPTDDSTFKLSLIADDSIEDSETFAPAGGTKVKKKGTGIYQYSFNAKTYTNEYIASFDCPVDSDIVNNDVYVKSASLKTFKYAALLRPMVDKARKSISDDIENMDQGGAPTIRFFYGYDTSHMIYYMERGLEMINIVPPYTYLTIDTFPDQYGNILIDAAVIAALESQGILAIDTDFNYSLGSNSLVIDHFTKLSSMISTLIARFDKNVTSFKKLYLSSGIVLYQFLPGGIRAARQLTALPGGFWSRLLSGAGY